MRHKRAISGRGAPTSSPSAGNYNRLWPASDEAPATPPALFRMEQSRATQATQSPALRTSSLADVRHMSYANGNDDVRQGIPWRTPPQASAGQRRIGPAPPRRRLPSFHAWRQFSVASSISLALAPLRVQRRLFIASYEEMRHASRTGVSRRQRAGFGVPQ